MHVDQDVVAAVAGQPLLVVEIQRRPRAMMAEHFTAEERQLFERGMRPVVEDPKAMTTDRCCT
ncbi:MAG: hypothetical protein ACREV7_15190 [Steroidobacteraceae bacterium]